MKTQQEAVKKGDVVSVEYTGKLGDGEVFDSSTGREPLHFAVGSGQVIPGFDKAVDGMKKGESKKVTIPCAEAYGPINTELLKEIPREKIPLKEELKAGMMLMMQGPDGQRLPVRVANVTPKTVTLDMNHPLAGKDLTFEIKVMGINDVDSKAMEGDCCGSGSCGSASGECSEGGCSGSCSPEGCEKEDCCKKEGKKMKEESHGGGCCH